MLSDPLPGWGFYAFGEPAPQGSKKHVGHGVMIESSKRVRPWRQAVADAGLGAGPCLDGPLAVTMIFTVRRPVGARRTQVVPDRTPDLSKLARAVEDSVTDIGLWADDARVSVYAPLAKAYPGFPYPGVPGELILPVSGVLVAAVSVSPSVETAPVAPLDTVDMAVAAKTLGLPKTAVTALSAGEPLTPERVDGWVALRRDDPDRFAALVADARAAEPARRAATKAAKAAPAVVPDYHERLYTLAAGACTDAWDRSERWRDAVGA